jgi:ACS family phthalate transporter-like MFS transporter
MVPEPQPSATDTAAVDVEATYRKITRRIIPFLILCYIFNFLDRVNIGIAHLQFNQDLGFDDTIYGIGTGIFFVGWLFFEVPSNLMLDRVGFRKTLLRIMAAWGLVSAGTMLVTTPAQFYTARFLLGAAEAGFIPGIFLYLTYWYPSTRRARMTSLFYLALPLSGLIGNPLSGWIMETFDGVRGWHGWQWLFVLEGMPSVLLGIVAYFYLDDRPAHARWLSDAEKAVVARALAAEETVKSGTAPRALAQAFRDPRLYVLGAVSFGSYCLANTISYWSPAVIQASGVSSVLQVGLVSAVPFMMGAVMMVFVSRHSDRTLERRWHAALCLMLSAAALFLLPTFSGQTLASVLLLGAATAGHYSTLSVFWTIPSGYLSKSAAAGGIALVSTIGAMGAAISPVVLGWTRTATGSLATGLYLTAAVVLLGSVTLLVGMPARLLPSRRPETEPGPSTSAAVSSQAVGSAR